MSVTYVYFMKEREKSLRHRALWKDKYLRSEILLDKKNVLLMVNQGN
jgi:hypothetical protein